jgi:hypothetical protein
MTMLRRGEGILVQTAPKSFNLLRHHQQPRLRRLNLRIPRGKLGRHNLVLPSRFAPRARSREISPI